MANGEGIFVRIVMICCCFSEASLAELRTCVFNVCSFVRIVSRSVS